LAFLTQNKAKLSDILIKTLVFEKNANFFAENCQNSQKIMIITSIPGASPTITHELQRQRCKNLQRQRCKNLQRQRCKNLQRQRRKNVQRHE
jgi:hypothetical protein